MLLVASSSNDFRFEFAGSTFSFSSSFLLPPLLSLELQDFVAIRVIFGSDIRVVVDDDVVVVFVAALDGLAGGAGLEGPPAASDEAVAAA